MNPVPLPRTVAVLFRRQEGIAYITLNRPDALNAIDPETHAELVELWNRFRDDDELRVAVLAGAGDRAFCAGIDLKRLDDFYRAVPAGRRREAWAREPGLGGLTRNLDPGKPVLAAIHGHCLGGGLELALACDVRLASEDAQFGLPEVRWGIVPGQGGTQRLPRLVPVGLAYEMILTGRPIDARRALAAGLVTTVVPRDRLEATATALARAIADQPPEAVRRAREAIRRGLEMPLAEALRLEQDLADPLRGQSTNRERVGEFAGAPRGRPPAP
jgi:enoyl-CoA hydratase/carnithine racemase